MRGLLGGRVALRPSVAFRKLAVNLVMPAPIDPIAPGNDDAQGGEQRRSRSCDQAEIANGVGGDMDACAAMLGDRPGKADGIERKSGDQDSCARGHLHRETQSREIESLAARAEKEI